MEPRSGEVNVAVGWHGAAASPDLLPVQKRTVPDVEAARHPAASVSIAPRQIDECLAISPANIERDHGVG